MEELKEKYGVKISGSTLDRIVRMGKEAKGNQVCFVRKKYDATKLSYLTAEVASVMMQTKQCFWLWVADQG